jgi:hypothetical protein
MLMVCILTNSQQVVFQILDGYRIYFIFTQCLKAIKHGKSNVRCKYHLHRNKRTLVEPQPHSQCTLATSIAGVLLTLFRRQGEAMCDEAAPYPQGCCVQCKKSIRLIVESVGLSEPFCVVCESRYRCT